MNFVTEPSPRVQKLSQSNSASSYQHKVHLVSHYLSLQYCMVVMVTSQCSHIALWSISGAMSQYLLQYWVMVTSQCSHIAWYCGLLVCALCPSTSHFSTVVMVTSQCSHIAWYCGLLVCALCPNTSFSTVWLLWYCII